MINIKRNGWKMILVMVSVFIMAANVYAEEEPSILDSIETWFGKTMEDSKTWAEETKTWAVDTWNSASDKAEEAWDDVSSWADQKWDEASAWAEENWENFSSWVDENSGIIDTWKEEAGEKVISQFGKIQNEFMDLIIKLKEIIQKEYGSNDMKTT